MAKDKLTKLEDLVLSVLFRSSETGAHAQYVGQVLSGTRQASDLLKRLENKKFVARSGKQAGRWPHWRITEAGRAMLAAAGGKTG